MVPLKGKRTNQNEGPFPLLSKAVKDEEPQKRWMYRTRIKFNFRSIAKNKSLTRKLTTRDNLSDPRIYCFVKYTNGIVLYGERVMNGPFKILLLLLKWDFTKLVLEQDRWGFSDLRILYKHSWNFHFPPLRSFS